MSSPRALLAPLAGVLAGALAVHLLHRTQRHMPPAERQGVPPSRFYEMAPAAGSGEEDRMISSGWG
jgi:hypothetical protein